MRRSLAGPLPRLIKRLLGLAWLVYSAPAFAADCQDTDQIVWKVEGGFATFKGEEARRVGDKLLDDIAEHHGKVSTETSADPASAYDALVRTLVKTPLRDGSYLFENTYWDRTKQEYQDRADLLAPPVSYIHASLPDSTTANCQWTVGREVIGASCMDARLPVARNPRSHKLQTNVAVTDTGGRHATTCVTIEERLIVGLGDSYASGEGNPDRPTRWTNIPAVLTAQRLKNRRVSKTDVLWYRNKNGPLAIVAPDADAEWWDNSCHRSLLSQQALAAMVYGAHQRHRQVVFLSFACSGATVIDGIVGPRFEAPGVTRLPEPERPKTPALAQSQLAQAQHFLCTKSPSEKPLPVWASMTFWKQLKHSDGTPVATPSIPICAGEMRIPDAILLSIGGNDIGFGGVGYWAIVPPVDRGLLPIDFVTRASVTADHEAAKQDFGLVCPDNFSEKRCHKSKFTARQLLGELPDLQRYMDEALSLSGLSAPTKIQMSYPPVARDERGELCGDLWAARTGNLHETENEPWMPLYGEVLDTFRIGRFTPAALRGPWSFGIFNVVSENDCAQHREARQDQAREMCIIERDVYDKLNAIVAAHRGWTVLPAASLPQNHGLCASSKALSDLVDAQRRGRPSAVNSVAIRDLSRREFGWPRWHKGWNDAWPAPQDWSPYEVRPRWFRTATDSALTQSVFDGGTRIRRNPGARTETQRNDENTSGTIHPTLQMHAAMAEQIAAALEEGR